jgi:hypothetical protein
VPLGELGVNAGCTDLAQIPIRLTVTVEPNVSSDQPRHLGGQIERAERMVDDPLPNLRMLVRESQELVETMDQGRYAHERRGLLD